jgi:hypothetical protein
MNRKDKQKHSIHSMHSTPDWEALVLVLVLVLVLGMGWLQAITTPPALL